MKFVSGEMESMSQEGMEIRSGDTQELLVSVIKALSNHIVRKSEPTPVLVQPQMTIVASPEVTNDITETHSDSVPENGRRFASIAANPYTGVLHYVYYPSYYSVVG